MRFFQWFKREILMVIPVFLFFFVFFMLISAAEVYLYHLKHIPVIKILFAAALIAKIMMVLDKLYFIDYCKKYPLIYDILWKTFIYFCVLLLVRLVIHVIPHLVSEGFTHPFSEIDWSLLISIQIYYLMLLFIFVTFRELTFKIGTERMINLFLKKPTSL